MEEKNNLQNPIFLNVIFIGRTLLSEGEKDGKKWEKFKLIFEKDNNKIYTTCFRPLSEKSIDPLFLEVGKSYNIGYNEKEFNGYINKEIFYVNLTKRDMIENDEIGCIPNKMALDRLNEYLKNIKEKGYDIPKRFMKSHFIGSVIRKEFPKITESLEKIFDENMS